MAAKKRINQTPQVSEILKQADALKAYFKDNDDEPFEHLIRKTLQVSAIG